MHPLSFKKSGKIVQAPVSRHPRDWSNGNDVCKWPLAGLGLCVHYIEVSLYRFYLPYTYLTITKAKSIAHYTEDFVVIEVPLNEAAAYVNYH